MTLAQYVDAELWATGYLRSALAASGAAVAAGVKVDNKVPNPRPAKLVAVRRDGGPRLDAAREAARLAVRVWATTEADATALANLVRALLDVAADGDPVLRVDQLSGPSPVADESGQPLRYMVIELILRIG